MNANRTTLKQGTVDERFVPHGKGVIVFEVLTPYPT
jgi:hypothetical protein